MRKYLCVSLCLGVMASACKKKYTQADLDAARASGSTSGTATVAGTGGTGTTTTTKTKEQVLKACLPQINSVLIGIYGTAVRAHFYLRRSTALNGTQEAPTLVLFTGANMPLQFQARTTTGLGLTAAAVTTNLNELAESADVQAQFVARAEGSGYRVHISVANQNTVIPGADAGAAPPAPDPATGLKIYNRESLAVAGQGHDATIANAGPLNANAADPSAGWYDCEVNDKTQDVAIRFVRAAITANPA